MLLKLHFKCNVKLHHIKKNVYIILFFWKYFTYLFLKFIILKISKNIFY